MVHMNNGDIRAISISEKRGQLKTEVPEARLISGHGIENDGHAGNWERQVTCLDWARVEKANEEHGLDAGPGDFAENILIEGIELSSLDIGTRLRLGASAILEVAQIGKEDHPSVVREKFGISLLPKEGLFCKVLEGGSIRKGDPVEVLTRR
jgi:MOSC domain-containing protein YiiM